MIKGKDCVGGITGNMDYVLTVYLNPTISVNKAYNYGNIEGETNVAGIFGRVHLENTCYVDNLFGDEYGTLLLSNSGDWTNAGSVSCKTSDGGELIGSFWADGYNYSVSTIDNYTVTGKIILNGEEVEADVGSALTKLSLTNRKLVETEDSDSQNEVDNNGTSTQ